MIRSHHASRLALAVALVAGGSVAARAADGPTATAPTADAAVPGDGDGDGGANPIVVTGAAKKQTVSAGALGPRSLLETPFSVGTVDAEQIQRLAATTIDAAFTYDAGVRSNNSGVASGNTFSVRGIAIDRTNGYKLDGLPFPYWYQDHPIEHLQDIQILKGAGGFAYGFAAPGGVVNLASKQPTRTFQALFDLSYRSSSILREHLDIGGPLDAEGRYAFRLNAVNEEGRLYNGAYNKDQFVSLALTGRVTDKLDWQLDGFYQRTRQDDQVNTLSILTTTTTINGVTYKPVTSLTPTSGDLQPGARGTTKFNDIVSLTGRVNYEIAHDWKASVAARYAALDERFPGSLATIYDNAGDYYSTAYNMNRLFRYYVGDASVNGKVRTGPITHQIAVGASSLTVQFDYDNPTRSTVIGTGYNIYNANNVPTLSGNAAALYNNRPPVWTRYQEVHQRALYASDTLGWGPVSVLLGLRYTDYEEVNFNPNSSTSSYFHYHPVSPVYSISVAVLPTVRVYATYVEALQRGALAPASTTNANASFGPLKTTQYEAGVKAEGRWGSANLAFYRIATPSEYTDTTNTFVRNGTARYQGIEFNATLHPIRDLLLTGSVAYLDAKQISGPSNLIGQTIAGTTDFQISGLAEYSLPFLPGVKLTGGIHHSGRAYGASNIFVFHSSTVGDLGASYGFNASGHAVVVRANIQNIADTRYWVPGSVGTSLSPGAPRTFTVSAQVALQADHANDAPSDGGVIGAGASERHRGRAYLELDAGGAFPAAYQAAVLNKVTDPTAASGAIRVGQKAGWDLDGVLGYDLGRFSVEVEAGAKRYSTGAVAYTNANVAVDASGRGAGDYPDAGGRTSVLSAMFNGLITIGHRDGATRAFAGGGFGLARVSTGRWTLDRTQASNTFTSSAASTAATPTYFSADNATGFAWQALAGVRHQVAKGIDVVLKYRYFEVPSLTLRTTNGNALKGNLSSNSVQAGIAFRL